MNHQLTILFFVLVSFGCSATSQYPKLVITPQIQDLGEINHDSTYTVKFQLKNVGSKILIIDTITSSCGCTVPKLYTHNLTPFEATILLVEFKPIDTGAFKKAIIIKSNTDSNFSILSFKGTSRKL